MQNMIDNPLIDVREPGRHYSKAKPEISPHTQIHCANCPCEETNIISMLCCCRCCCCLLQTPSIMCHFPNTFTEKPPRPVPKSIKSMNSTPRRYRVASRYLHQSAWSATPQADSPSSGECPTVSWREDHWHPRPSQPTSAKRPFRDE